MNILDKKRLLGHLQEDEKELGTRILDVASQAYRNNEPAYTDFLDPRGQEIAEGIIRGIGSLDYRWDGGYRGAERRRGAIYPDYYLTELLEIPLTAVAVEGNFEFMEVGQRDFLGAVLSCGIRREKVGDVLLTSRGGQVVLAPEVLPAVLYGLEAVHRVPVQVREIDLEQLEVVPRQVREIKTTVASLRLDAVASSGFGTSRTRMARDIKAQKVKVNWQVVDNPAHSVAVGDILSMRGRGRVEIAGKLGETRKGRISLLLKRYI